MVGDGTEAQNSNPIWDELNAINKLRDAFTNLLELPNETLKEKVEREDIWEKEEHKYRLIADHQDMTVSFVIGIINGMINDVINMRD